VPSTTVVTVTPLPAPAPSAPDPGVLGEQETKPNGGSSSTAGGPSSLAETGSSPVGLLVASALLLLGGLVLGDVSRRSRRQ
jgi:hypothetical protein